MLPLRARMSNGDEGVLKHSPKLQHYWSLTIRLFSVISRTLIGGVLLLCKDVVSVFYSPSRLGQVTLMWSRTVGESCWESKQPADTELKQKFLTLYNLKTPMATSLNAHALLVFHWSQFTPTHFFMTRDSCPRIACFLLVTGYIRVIFMPQVLRPRISIFLVGTLLILSTTGYISTLSAGFTACQGNILHW